MKEPKIVWKQIIPIAISIALLIFVGFQAVVYSLKVRSAWSEIQFALDKPKIIKAIRVEYQDRQNRLEKDITERQKSAEDKLVEEVVNQMQEKN